MTRPGVRFLLLGAAICSGGALAQRSNCAEWADITGDAMVRRTDHGNDGAIGDAAMLPDVIEISLCAWEAFDPANDPYSGHVVDSASAHLFRLDVVFAGVLNPPGPLGLNGELFDPYRYGPSPLLGFVDIDVDGEKDSGGELGGAAELRYLANVARFARIPRVPFGERAAKSRGDLDGWFYSDPQYERSGADFALVLCGCFTPTVAEVVGDADGTFEFGETWLVFGRFFERSQGYRDASGATGGSAPGLYDPVVEIRFEHDASQDQTVVTLVWALDPTGAAELAGEPEEPIDLNVANHTSLVEALCDIITGANEGGIFGPAWELVREWEGERASEHTDIEGWGRVTGLVGAPYAQPGGALYVWTDTLGDETPADLDGDGVADEEDEELIRDEIYDLDGTARDADGSVNGVVVIPDPGWDFSLYDTDGDMLLNLYDQAPYGPLGDFNGDGKVDTQDVIAFLNAWVDRLESADFNLDQTIDTRDFIIFLDVWAGG